MSTLFRTGNRPAGRIWARMPRGAAASALAFALMVMPAVAVADTYGCDIPGQQGASGGVGRTAVPCTSGGGGGGGGGGNNSGAALGLGLFGLGLLLDMLNSGGGSQANPNGNQAQHLHKEAQRFEAAGDYIGAKVRFEMSADLFRKAGDYENSNIADSNAALMQARLDHENARKRAEEERQELAAKENAKQRRNDHLEREAAELLARADREEREQRERLIENALRRPEHGTQPPANQGAGPKANPFTNTPTTPPQREAHAAPRAPATEPPASPYADNPFNRRAAELPCPAQPTTREQISNCYTNIRNQMVRSAQTCGSSAQGMTTPGGGTGAPAPGQRYAFDACQDLNRRAAQYADCVAGGIMQPGSQYNPLVRACGQKYGFVEGDRVVTGLIPEPPGNLADTAPAQRPAPHPRGYGGDNRRDSGVSESGPKR